MSPHASLRRRRGVTAAMCLVVLALLAVIPVFANTAVGYIPLIAALVVLVLSRAYLAVLERGVVSEEDAVGRGCTRGDTLRFPLELKNRSFLPAPRIDALFYISDIFGEGGSYQTRRVTLPPRSSNTFDLGVRFDHIGNVEVGILQIALYDPLGIFCSVRDNDWLHHVQILPRVADISSLEVSDYSLRESQTNIRTFINDGMDYSGIRDYHWGDPMKSIHWKLSSKAIDTYFTRLYETPTTPGLAIFIDFECAAQSPEQMMRVYDAVVESALSIERYASQSGYDTEVLYVDSRGAYQRLEGPIGDRYGNFMRHVPRVSAGDGHTFQGLVIDEAHSITCQNNLVVCTANVNEELVTSLVSIAGPTRTPFLVAVDGSQSADTGVSKGAAGKGANGHASPVSAAGDMPTMLKRLSASRIPCVTVRGADDLKAKVS